MTCIITHKGDGLQFNICACYWREIALNVGLDAPFYSEYDWTGIYEKEGEITSIKSSVTNNETSKLPAEFSKDVTLALKKNAVTLGLSVREYRLKN